MSWAKLDDGFYSQPEVLETSLEGIGVHGLALAYCARHLTDGRLSLAAVMMLARGAANATRISDELVATHLWVRDGSGFALRDYLATNPSAKAVNVLQKAARRRMQKFRGRAGGVRANQQRTNAFVPERSGEELSSAAPEGKEREKGEETAFQAFYAAYPRKAAPGDARKAWRQMAGDRPPLPNLLAAIARQKREDFRDRTPDRIPYPATWLRAQSWLNGEALDQPPAPVVVVQPTALARKFAERDARIAAERAGAGATSG